MDNSELCGFSRLPSRSSILNFAVAPSTRGDLGTDGRTTGCCSGKEGISHMRKSVMAIATAATIGVTALVAPSPAQAWRGGWGPGLAGGLIAGAVIGGIASNAYGYGPGYGYYGGPGYGYYGGARTGVYWGGAPP